MNTLAVTPRQTAIGDAICQSRKSRALTLQDVADRIETADRVDDLDTAALARIESGERRVASHELAELAEVLDVQISSLLGRAPSPAARLATRIRNLPDYPLAPTVPRRR